MDDKSFSSSGESTIIPNNPQHDYSYKNNSTLDIQKKKKSNKGLIWTIIVLQLIIVGGLVFFIVNECEGDKDSFANKKTKDNDGILITNIDSNVDKMVEVEENESNRKESAYNGMKKWLKQASQTTKYRDEDGYDSKRVGTTYYLYDITNDGIPELWIEYEKYIYLPDNSTKVYYNNDYEEDYYTESYGDEYCDYNDEEYDYSYDTVDLYSYVEAGTILDCYMWNSQKGKIERVFNRRDMKNPSFLGNTVYTFGDGYYDRLTYDQNKHKIIVSKYNDSNYPSQVVKMMAYNINDLEPLKKKLQ